MQYSNNISYDTNSFPQDVILVNLGLSTSKLQNLGMIY